MSHPSELDETPASEDESSVGSSLRSALVRFGLLVALAAVGAIVLFFTPLGEMLEEESLFTAWLNDLRQAWWAPMALVGLYLVLCPLGLPASPLILAGGFVFGTLYGSALNYLGTLLGAAVSFGLGRLLGRDLMAHILGDRLERVEAVLNRHGFWNLARIRFLPIPFPLVNYGAALAGVRAPVFLGGTALGLAPAVVLFTWFASALSHATDEERSGVLLQMGLAMAAVVVFSFLPALLRGWSRRRRYRRLMAERRTGRD